MKRDAKIGLFIVLVACIVSAWLVGRALSRPGIVVPVTGADLSAADNPQQGNLFGSETGDGTRTTKANELDRLLEPQTWPNPAPGAGHGATPVVNTDTQRAAETSVYITKGGDNFWVISQKVYGTGKHFDLLAKANPQIDPMRMSPKMKVTVPAIPGVSRRIPAENNEAATDTVRTADRTVAAAGRDVEYTIQSGDRLEALSKKYYGSFTKFDAILQANPGINPMNLKIGTKIKIPGATQGQ
jgi:nucleoid-associated protein YgaU